MNLDDFDGPEIEIYPSQYRVVRGRRNRRREPPIYWKNLWWMIVSLTFSVTFSILVHRIMWAPLHRFFYWLFTLLLG